MPKRTDIHSILIIGSGPIVIGQGCEFDYSGVQACRALKEEGYRVVLINSNPATIMTDPEFADATYIEPITVEAVEKILKREKEHGTPVDALLPTLGGQTGLNTGMACFDQGILTRYGVQMIGADREAIFKGEDRQVFKDLMQKIGLEVPLSSVVKTFDEAKEALKLTGLPAIIRPAFTLGGTGGGIAYNGEEFETIVRRGLDASPVGEVLIEQSVIGWKEFEMEVVRDRNDNAIIICSIENLDAMGVHTGDSITVAPIQTLTDKEYQRMRDASIAVIRAVGVETGGSNIQFGINPANGDMVVIEMNPRVSRSSALASKATGYPIAKIAAKLAVGYTLDELPNPITSRKGVPGKDDLHTSACFEPTIDYVVIKIPRFTFEKFPDADQTLTTQMKSVGEAMAIGRTFKEALQKGIRSMEIKRFGFGLDKNDKWLNSRSTGFQPVTDASRLQDHRLKTDAPADSWPIDEQKLRSMLAVPTADRLWYVRYALKMGWTIAQVHQLTKYDPWFIGQMFELVDFERVIESKGPQIGFELEHKQLTGESRTILDQAKQHGYSDFQLANLMDLNARWLGQERTEIGLTPVYKLVDTCAAEFEAATPYYYSTYESPTSSPATSNQQLATFPEDEIRLTDKPKVIIIGGGPNRIGQGIEFDYCCVHAAFAMKELGHESVMINSNPETVSTDYDTSDLLFFEPLTHEDILNICERLNGKPFDIAPPVLELGLVTKAKASEQHFKAIAREMTSRGHPFVAAYGYAAAGARDPDVVSAIYHLTDGEGRYWDAGFTRTEPTRPIVTEGASFGTPTAEQEQLLRSEVAKRRKAKSSGLVKGVIVQLGGQTPLNLARGLHQAGVPIIGTSVDALDRAGDREQFRELLQQLGLKQPQNGIAKNVPDAKRIANEIGYPVLVRPSFVLGGRAMEIVYDETQLDRYMREAIDASTLADTPILIDKFLDNADECDLDCLADYDDAGNGRAIVIGVMEHIEEAGIHSGDSACVLPPYTFSPDLIKRLKEQTYRLAKALKVRGLMNVQYAVKDDEIYVIEVNPRASRTVPFVGKATGMPWAKIAAKVMAGKTLDELGIHEQPDPKHVSVKEVVFPFSKFPGVDVILGPEMRSTGEVMGLDYSFPLAFAKSQLAAGTKLPLKGNVYISVAVRDREKVLPIAKQFAAMGFDILTSSGTGGYLAENGVKNTVLNKLSEGRPNIIDRMKNGDIALIVNTPTRKGPGTDEGKIRSASVMNRVPIFTTLTAASAVVQAIAALQKGDWEVRPLQAYFAKQL